MKYSVTEVIQLTKRLVYMYFLLKDSDGIMACLDVNATWKGLGADSKVYSRKELVIHLKEFLWERRNESFEVKHEKYKVVSYGENYYVIQAHMKFNKLYDGLSTSEVTRLSEVTIISRDDQLFVSKVEVRDVYEDNDARYFVSLEEDAAKTKFLDTILTTGFRTSRDNEEQTIIDVGDSLCQMLGYSKEELIRASGGELWKLVYQADIEAAKHEIKLCFLTSNEYTSKYRMRRKDGSLFWVWDTGIKTEDEEGHTVIQSLIADINELERSRFERDTTVDSFPGAVIFVKPIKDLVFVTRAKDKFYQMLKVTKEEYENTRGKYLHPDDIKKYEYLAETSMKQRGRMDMELRLIASDGELIWVRAIGQYYGESKGYEEYIFFLLNITRQKDAEHAIRREKERYCIATEGMADIVYEYDALRDMVQYHVDQKIKPYPSEFNEGIHENWVNTIRESKIIHKDDIVKVFELKNSDVFYNAEIRLHVLKNGKPCYQWFAFQATKIYDNKMLTRVVGIMRNIEEQKRIKAQNEELQQIFNLKLISDYDCIIKINVENDKIVHFATERTSLFTKELPSDREQTFSSMTSRYVHPLDRERYKKVVDKKWLMEALRSGREEITLYIRLRTEKDDYRWKCYRFSYLDPDLKYIICSIQDVHDARMEQQIHEENNQRILKEALEKTKVAKEATSRYFRLITEELKTPAQILSKMVDKVMVMPTEDAKKYMSRISEASQYLEHTMDNLIELEKVNSGELTMIKQSFDIVEMIEQETKKQTEALQQKEVEFNLDLTRAYEHTIVGDEYRLRQIISSLLVNSISFSLHHGFIHLTIFEENVDDQKIGLVIVLEDNGIPMKDGELARVYQENNDNIEDVWSARSSEIALSLSKELVELMGGTIDISYVVNQGNKITINLPVYRGKSLEIKEIPETNDDDTLKTDLKDFSFLIIEDPGQAPGIFHSILAVNNAIVDVVNSGQEALKTFALSPPAYFNVVLTDVQLSGMSSFEFARRLREMERIDAKKIPIIAVAQNAKDEEITACLSSGINMVLEKPVDIEKLKHLIEIYGGGSQIC